MLNESFSFALGLKSVSIDRLIQIGKVTDHENIFP